MCIFECSAHSPSLVPASTHTPSSDQYATSDTSKMDSKTSPDIDSSEPKSQEKVCVRFMYRHYVPTLRIGHCVQDTMYRTLCTGQFVQDAMYSHYEQDTMYRFYVQTLCTGHYVQDTMYRFYLQTLCTGHYVQTLCTDTRYRHCVQTLCTGHFVQYAVYSHYV